MIRNIIYFLVIGGLCVSQGAQSELEQPTQENSVDKNISLEIFAGAHFTLGHQMGFRAMKLPDYMILGGLQIAYPPSRHIVLSLAGSYSHAGDLEFTWVSPFLPPVMEFTYTCADFQVSYTNRIGGKLSYLIGTGINVSHIKVFQDDTTTSNSDVTVSSTYLKPLVNSGLNFDISRHLYSQIRMKCCFYYLFKTGQEGTDLGDILPSMSVGMGYMF